MLRTLASNTIGIGQDTKENIKTFLITKIYSQPADEDLNKLKSELSELVTSIPTINGGGSHGHVCMITDNILYCSFSNGGVPFVTPTNPGPYPTNVDPDTMIHEGQIAKHKAEV
jgi:hypothetical protein